MAWRANSHSGSWFFFADASQTGTVTVLKVVVSCQRNLVVFHLRSPNSASRVSVIGLEIPWLRIRSVMVNNWIHAPLVSYGDRWGRG
jgi:hypothetical protein